MDFLLDLGRKPLVVVVELEHVVERNGIGVIVCLEQSNKSNRK
jgi:hypothetical protein